MSAELKPCPFCGGSVSLELCHESMHHIYGVRKWWGVRCRNTANLGGTCCIEQVPSASQEAAVERWNRRPTAPTAPTLTDVEIDEISEKYDLAYMHNYNELYIDKEEVRKDGRATHQHPHERQERQQMRKIYLALGCVAYEGSWPIRAFESEDKTKEFCELCEEYHKTGRPSLQDAEIDMASYWEAENKWRAGHPAGEDGGYADSFMVSEIDFVETGE